MKIMVAVPAYDGKVHIETASALMKEQGLAGDTGNELQTLFLPGVSLITLARNQLAQGFLDSDADRLVFVDADVSWEPGSLIKLAHSPHDFVGGAYRLKQGVEKYPFGFLRDGTPPGELMDEATGCFQVAVLPGGFLSLSRSVFETLKAAHPGRSFSHYEFQGHGYFHAPVRDGVLMGEDSCFCIEYREAGGKVWLDPNLTLTHVGGVNRYEGNVARWMKSCLPAQTEEPADVA